MTSDTPQPAGGGDRPVPEAAGSDDFIGQVLSGRYEVQSRLGTGAMGAVYRARHTHMKTPVAVKILRPEVTDHGEVVERFKREAQAAAHIDHPNVCRATDFGPMDDGSFFLVMEFVEGRTLRDAAKMTRTLDPRRVVHIGRQVAGALARAHELGIVHRDLKPENIMLVQRPEDPDFVKILDFGIAHVRLVDEHESNQLTQAGRVYGTPAYMSPEQVAADEIDSRADLYSLGVVLFELINGDPPFDDDKISRVMAMHVHEPPPPVGQDCPADLADLIDRLLAKDPGDRPASAAAVAAEFDEIAGALESGHVDHPPESEPDTDAVGAPRGPIDDPVPTIFAPGGRGTRMLLAGGLVAVLAAAVVLALVFSEADSSETEPDEAVTIAEARAAFLEDAEATELLRKLESNDHDAVIARVETLRTEHAGNPHLAYLAGRAHSDANQWVEAVASYDRALELEPRYQADEHLLDDVFAQFASSDGAESAAALTRKHLTGPSANERLAEIAKSHERNAVQERALDLLKETGRLDELEQWNRLSVELMHVKGCKPTEEIIEAIVAEGDPRGAEALRRYNARPTRGCGFMKLNDCYKCVRQELRDGIDTLGNLDTAGERETPD